MYSCFIRFWCANYYEAMNQIKGRGNGIPVIYDSDDDDY